MKTWLNIFLLIIELALQPMKYVFELHEKANLFFFFARKKKLCVVFFNDKHIFSLSDTLF